MGRHEVPLEEYKKRVLKYLAKQRGGSATIRVIAFNLHARAEKIRDAVFELVKEKKVGRSGEDLGEGNTGYGRWKLMKKGGSRVRNKGRRGRGRG